MSYELFFVCVFFFTNSIEKHSENITVQQYKLQMEKEITALLKEIEGVGNVKVMISLESGEENIYVEQHKSSEDVQINQDGKSIIKGKFYEEKKYC